METITLENDITVFYITASSFPDGICNAFEELYAIVPPRPGRNYFGISRPENGMIVYRAAVEENSAGGATKLKNERLVLKKGKYIWATVTGFAKDVQRIGQAFRELLAATEIDPNGYCVEWYFNDTDVRCMIRLDQ